MTAKIYSTTFMILCWILINLMAPKFSFGNTTPTDTDETTVNQDSDISALGYIKDELFIYMHVGSSQKFKILGRITAGTPVEKLDEDLETKFIKIKDQKGRIGWIERNSFTTKIPKHQLLEESNAQIYQLKQKEQQSNQRIQELNKQHQLELHELKEQITNTQQIIQTMNIQLDQVQLEKKQLRQLAAQHKAEKSLKQMLLGGGLVLAGILFGLLFPYFLPRKRSADRWV